VDPFDVDINKKPAIRQAFYAAAGGRNSFTALFQYL
jgi:hypothetical protein